MASQEEKEATRLKQIEIAEQLQTLLLEDYLNAFKKGDITASDRANLFRMLEHGGWSLDPTRARRTVKDVLTETVDPKQFDKDDADIIPIQRKA